LKNLNISATERSILTKFGTMMRLGPPDTVSQFANSTIQDGGGGHFENLKKLQYACFG